LIGAAAGYLIIFIDEELTAVEMEMEMVGCLLVTAAAVLVDRPEDKGADKGGGDRDSTDSEGILPGPGRCSAWRSRSAARRVPSRSRLVAFAFVRDSCWSPEKHRTLLRYHRADSSSSSGSGIATASTG